MSMQHDLSYGEKRGSVTSMK